MPRGAYTSGVRSGALSRPRAGVRSDAWSRPRADPDDNVVVDTRFEKGKCFEELLQMLCVISTVSRCACSINTLATQILLTRTQTETQRQSASAGM